MAIDNDLLNKRFDELQSIELGKLELDASDEELTDTIRWWREASTPLRDGMEADWRINYWYYQWLYGLENASKKSQE